MILQPPSALLAGPPGSGKTSAIPTQLLHGLEVFVIVTEPDGVSSLIDAAERLKAPMDKLHWAYRPPASSGWAAIEEMITKITTMDQKQLADMRGLGKDTFRLPALQFLDAFRNFRCDRTGREYGDFTQWDDTRSLNVDSLSGWSIIGFTATVGLKPTANPGEWGIAQNFIFNMLVKINTDRKCFFNLISHIEKEMDELSGVRRVMVSTIGAKLAPKIPIFFSEVIRCSRTLDAKGKPDFRWSTIDNSMELKNRSLPIGENLAADFGPIIAAYRRRLASVQPSGTQTPSVPSSKTSSLTAKETV